MEENKVMDNNESTEVKVVSLEPNAVETDNNDDSMLPGIVIGGGLATLIGVGVWKIRKYCKRRKEEKEELEWYRKRYADEDDEFVEKEVNDNGENDDLEESKK